MRIDEAIAACEAHNPNLNLFASHEMQVCHHRSGVTSRRMYFRVTVIPDNPSLDPVRPYDSWVGFEQCVADLIQAEPKV